MRLKKWYDRKFDADAIEIYEPQDAPDLQPSIQALVDRVNCIDKGDVRLDVAPDRRLMGRRAVKKNFGHRVFQLLKTATGISNYRANKSWNSQWDQFTKDWDAEKQRKQEAATSGDVKEE